MSQAKFNVRKVAVLGAGVMGAQIAAHLVNAKVQTVLFDLPAKEGDKSSIALKAIANLKKLTPAPLAAADRADYITPANYVLYGYANAQAVVAALKAGEDLDAQAAWLRGNTVDSAIGKITWDEKGDIKDFKFVFYNFDDKGTPVLVN